MNRHRHAIEQASRRWRGGRRDDSARTRRRCVLRASSSSFLGGGGALGFGGPMTASLDMVRIRSVVSPSGGRPSPDINRPACRRHTRKQTRSHRRQVNRVDRSTAHEGIPDLHGLVEGAGRDPWESAVRRAVVRIQISTQAPHPAPVPSQHDDALAVARLPRPAPNRRRYP